LGAALRKQVSRKENWLGKLDYPGEKKFTAGTCLRILAEKPFSAQPGFAGPDGLLDSCLCGKDSRCEGDPMRFRTLECLFRWESSIKAKFAVYCIKQFNKRRAKK
jgi:hypothetical protein